MVVVGGGWGWIAKNLMHPSPPPSSDNPAGPGHSGPRMALSGNLVGNMPSTCLKMFTNLSEPHHTMEAWIDVRI